MRAVGMVEAGSGTASGLFAAERNVWWAALGFVPFPGTLNVKVGSDVRRRVMGSERVLVRHEGRGQPLFRVRVDGVNCWAKTSRDPHTLEVVHEERLRDRLGVADGSRVIVEFEETGDMKLSVSVMAHPDRDGMVRSLLKRLDREPVGVAWDPLPSSKDCEQRWANGRRAWQLHDPDADWHMVVQDDAVPCRSLVAGLELGLDQLGPDGLMTAYAGAPRRDQQHIVRAISNAKSAGHSWFPVRSLCWGVAILVPTHAIGGMLEWCDGEVGDTYDRRIGRYFRDVVGWQTWHPVDSLVDHVRGPSLVGHSWNRFSGSFVGKAKRATDYEWERHDGLDPNVQ